MGERGRPHRIILFQFPAGTYFRNSRVNLEWPRRRHPLHLVAQNARLHQVLESLVPLRLFEILQCVPVLQSLEAHLLVEVAPRDQMMIDDGNGAVYDLGLRCRDQQRQHECPQHGIYCVPHQNVCPMLKKKLKWRTCSTCGTAVQVDGSVTPAHGSFTGNTGGVRLYPRSTRTGPIGVR